MCIRDSGNTLMWGLTWHTNFNDPSLSLPKVMDPPVPAYQASQVDSLEQVDWSMLSSQLASNGGWQQASLYSDKETMTLEAEQTRYLSLIHICLQTTLVCLATILSISLAGHPASTCWD